MSDTNNSLSDLFDEPPISDDIETSNTDNDISIDDLFSFLTEEDSNSTGTQKLDEFGFYISLMGINPLVVYKEDEKLLFDIMMASGDVKSIKLLLNNLNDFIDELYKNSVYLFQGNLSYVKESEKYNYLSTKNAIIENYKQKVAYLISRFNSVTNLSLSGKQDNVNHNLDVRSLFSTQSISAPNISGRGGNYKLQYHYTINNILPLTISELTSLLNEINFIKSYKNNIDSRIDNDLIEEYRIRTYDYTSVEVEVLDALKFPPVFKCENLLKQNTTTRVNRDTRLTDMYRSISYNNVFCDMIQNLIFIKRALENSNDSIIYNF